MHSVKMRPVATHVAWFICLFVTTVGPTKTDERIQQTHPGGVGQRFDVWGYTLALLGEYECFSCHLFRLSHRVYGDNTIAILWI